jgi:hypothetical protein
MIVLMGKVYRHLAQSDRNTKAYPGLGGARRRRAGPVELHLLLALDRKRRREVERVMGIEPT